MRLSKQNDEISEKNSQLYGALRCLTEGTPFTYVDNSPSGDGFEAWRALHAQCYPSTGGRKKVMLNALIRPDRASYEQLAGALERWKALRVRCERKKDQLGKRTPLDESIAMNSLENLVPKDLENHFLMNHSRLTGFNLYEQEIRLFVEAKTGAKLKIGGDFGKEDGPTPMDVGSLMASVGSIGDLAAFAKAYGKGGKSNKGGLVKFEGECRNCGKKGRKESDCWRNKKEGSGKESGGDGKGKGKKFEGVCNNCQKVGHKAADCWAGQAASKGKGGKKGKGKGGKGKGVGACDVEEWPEEDEWPADETAEVCGLECAESQLT